jgi:hypothetical protein
MVQPNAAAYVGMSANRRQYCRYQDGHDAAIQPLLQKLSFTGNRVSWGQVFRRGTFQIEPGDLQIIAAAMGISAG